MNISLSNDDMLASIPSEFDMKVSSITTRNKNISDLCFRLNRMTGEVQKRSNTLQAYAMSLFQLKNTINNNKKEYINSINNQFSKFEQEALPFEKKLNELLERNKKIKEKQKSNQNLFEEMNKNIIKYENEIQDIEKSIAEYDKNAFDFSNTMNELRQLNLIHEETKSHYFQYQIYVETLFKETSLIEQSIKIMKQKEESISTLISTEIDENQKQKTRMISKIEQLKADQKHFNDEKEILCNEKQKLLINQKKIFKAIERASESVKFFEDCIKQSTYKQKTKIRQIYLINNKQCPDNSPHFMENTNRRMKSRRNENLIEISNIRSMIISVSKERDKAFIKNQQFLNKVSSLIIELEDLYLLTKIDSDNYPNIFGFMYEFKNLTKFIIGEKDKWQQCNGLDQKSIGNLLTKWECHFAF